MWEEYEDYRASRTSETYDSADAALAAFDRSTRDDLALAAFDAQYSQSDNSPVTMSTPGQTGGQKGDQFASVNDTLKKLGGLASTVSLTARQFGQAVGAIEGSVNNAQAQFQAGRTDAKRVTPAYLWWDTAPTTDKVALILAGIGVYLALR